MSRLNEKLSKAKSIPPMAMCKKCRSDLVARENGNVYCSNLRCTFHNRKHPTGQTLNEGY